MALDVPSSEPDFLSISPQLLEKHLRIAMEQMLSSLFPQQSVLPKDAKNGELNSAETTVVGGIDFGAPPPPRVIPADVYPTQGEVLHTFQSHKQYQSLTS